MRSALGMLGGAGGAGGSEGDSGWIQGLPHKHCTYMFFVFLKKKKKKGHGERMSDLVVFGQLGC